MTSHGLWTLCNSPEPTPQWKSESVTFQPTNGLTEAGGSYNRDTTGHEYSDFTESYQMN